MFFTILLMSSEKALSPLFEDSGSESSPSLLPEDDIKPKSEEKKSTNKKQEAAVNRNTRSRR